MEDRTDLSSGEGNHVEVAFPGNDQKGRLVDECKMDRGTDLDKDHGRGEEGEGEVGGEIRNQEAPCGPTGTFGFQSPFWREMGYGIVPCVSLGYAPSPSILPLLGRDDVQYHGLSLFLCQTSTLRLAPYDVLLQCSRLQKKKKLAQVLLVTYTHEVQNL